MGFKANQLAIEKQEQETTERLANNFTASAQYSREIGNIYTASLYLSLLSLLENGNLAPEVLVGLFSYGSGAMGEFYAGQVVAEYQNALDVDGDQEMIARRQKVSVSEYEQIFTQALELPQDNLELESDEETGYWYFAGTEDHVRQYKQK